MKKILFSILLFSFFISCKSLNKSNPLFFDLTGTTWEYTDEDWTYKIEFLENEKIKTTHPNESTPHNDQWKQRKNKLKFEYNDGFAKYKGKIISIDLIEGVGSNGGGEWEWEMRRIK
ncbi:hypothetical protein [Maribacter sp. R77961]|uniref:hypothetical protein n=1 Tax=Maribacter sp. R77961 TaxID=3093871 RepID=UPI0037C7E569